MPENEQQQALGTAYFGEGRPEEEPVFTACAGITVAFLALSVVLLNLELYSFYEVLFIFKMGG